MSSKKYAFKAKAAKAKTWKYKAYPQKDVEKLAARFKARWLQVKDEEKITQTEFADKIGVTQPALNQFLNGATPISNAQIISICRELGSSPKEMVKGIKFFEPFFNHIVVTRQIRVRYKLSKAGIKETKVTGEVISYHVDLPDNVDLCAVEITDDEMSPRYNKGEKLVIAAQTPNKGQTGFGIQAGATAACVGILKRENRMECLMCHTTHETERIDTLHTVVGLIL